ncbi:M9 family metallopeptidase [Kitasatospora sp. NPDC002040]|uniref:M9 family metallopeptidase n=1 Tax=Kitasatospora sp. NPDC002040 TaxID=3154661 RepID=UPI00332A684C
MRSSRTTRDVVRLLIAALICCLGLTLLAPGGRAAAVGAKAPAPVPAPAPKAGPAPQAATEVLGADARAEAAQHGTAVSERPPLRATESASKREQSLAKPQLSAGAAGLAAACNVSDFTSKTGAALVSQIKASDLTCINTLFQLTGSNAQAAFREAQMVTVANALRTVSANYPGDNSTSAGQLVLFLRAGYFVHWYNESTVGTYGPALKSGLQGGLDAFFAASRSRDVTDANGETLAEAVILIDSAQENARYLSVVKRLLTGYSTSYDSSYYMVAAVNNTYTVLFRGHQNADFLPAVQADTSVLSTLRDFAVAHDNLLGTDKSYLTANAGRELGRFLSHPELLTTVRPLVKQLLDRTSISGRTASLWMGLAEMTNEYDAANCSYYGTCDLVNRARAAALTSTQTCSPSVKIVAQQMTAAEFSATCASLAAQDAFFHNVVKDSGAVANDNNTTIEVNVFNSSADYQIYAGVIFGIDTDNGGMYLEGNPAAAGNQPRFIAYEAEWVRPDFQIWNLNHEYTHYLDGRFDMYGDFDSGMTTPTVMWVEGFAEYISYSYRNVNYDDAVAEARKNTYKLSTLFDTTYDNADQTRIYNWGYLAVRYLLQSHPADVTTLLGYYRTGNWAAARTLLTSTIGTRYDADFAAWLAACGAGNCGTLPPPGGPTECTAADTRVLEKNCGRSNLSATTGNYRYFYLNLPAGTSSLKITVAGGTGNADLYYSPSSWATTSSYTARSSHAGNAETLTVTNPPAGYVYVSLLAVTGFDKVTVSTQF